MTSLPQKRVLDEMADKEKSSPEEGENSLLRDCLLPGVNHIEILIYRTVRNPS